jgi:excinuclease UvrABC helicase subunit UvrB
MNIQNKRVIVLSPHPITRLMSAEITERFKRRTNTTALEYHSRTGIQRNGVQREIKHSPKSVGELDSNKQTDLPKPVLTFV